MTEPSFALFIDLGAVSGNTYCINTAYRVLICFNSK